MYAAIKGCLERPEAVRRLYDAMHRHAWDERGLMHEEWIDEQARTLVGVVDEVLAELADAEVDGAESACPRCHGAPLTALVEADGSVVGDRCTACGSTWRTL